MWNFPSISSLWVLFPGRGRKYGFFSVVFLDFYLFILFSGSSWSSPLQAGFLESPPAEATRRGASCRPSLVEHGVQSSGSAAACESAAPWRAEPSHTGDQTHVSCTGSGLPPAKSPGYGLSLSKEEDWFEGRLSQQRQYS